jgi:hypothetical protein
MATKLKDELSKRQMGDPVLIYYIESTRVIGTYLLVGIIQSDFFPCEEFSTFLNVDSSPRTSHFWESDWVLYTKYHSTSTRDELHTR